MYWIVTGRRLLGILGAVVLLLVGGTGIGLAQRCGVAATGANWGLSFQNEGMPPVGNASAQELAALDAHYIGDTNQKRIYLTFDAGFENGYTPAILDTLKKHQVPAAFFVVGHYLESAPALVQRMAEEGHLVANHTYSHPDMSAIGSRDTFVEELTRVESAYQEVTGQEMPKIYRPPQGKYSKENLQLAKEAGYHTFFWSLAYVDWYTDRQPTREQAFEKLLGRIHPGAIVLLHSTSSTNAQILDELLSKWKEMGYSFGVLTELCTTDGAY